MDPNKTAKQISVIASWIILIILALLPFHAFLTVWFSSLFGHYTMLRLWKEILLVPVFVGSIYIVAFNAKLRQKLFSDWLNRLILIYVLLLAVVGAMAFSYHDVSAKALAYGELVDLRFLIFFLMVLIIVSYSPILIERWKTAVILPATVVIIFALLQFLALPYDFLSHFGYGVNTIFPYETINHNLNHLRVASTLRGANPLGAYLVLVMSTALALLLKSKPKRLSEIIWLGAALLAMFFSFSRSAWIGLIVSAAIIFWLSLKSEKLRRQLLVAAGVIVLIAGVVGLALHNNTTFQDDILHTDNHSTALVSSNQGHTAAFKDGVHDIVHQPQGGGVGSAGPQSVYNNHPGRIAENYFLQIGQEAGILGIGLFIAINVLAGLKLWRIRQQPLALALFASLIGLTIVNMLSHAWSDDTLAYIWWGLAGVAIAPHLSTARQSRAS